MLRRKLNTNFLWGVPSVFVSEHLMGKCGGSQGKNKDPEKR